MYVNFNIKAVNVDSECPHGAYTANCGCEPVIKGTKVTWVPKKAGS